MVDLEFILPTGHVSAVCVCVCFCHMWTCVESLQANIERTSVVWYHGGGWGFFVLCVFCLVENISVHIMEE